MNNDLASWERTFHDYLDSLPWSGHSRVDWGAPAHVDIEADPLDTLGYGRTTLALFDRALLLRNSKDGPALISLPGDLSNLDILCGGSSGWNYLCGIGSAPVVKCFAEYGSTYGSGALRVAPLDQRKRSAT